MLAAPEPNTGCAGLNAKQVGTRTQAPYLTNRSTRRQVPSRRRFLTFLTLSLPIAYSALACGEGSVEEGLEPFGKRGCVCAHLDRIWPR